MKGLLHRTGDTARPHAAPRRWRPRNWGGVLLGAWFLLLPQAALAISLYDIVRMSKAGYTDPQIIDLIEVTDSRFILDTDSLIKLKKEGVSETLMLALLEASEQAPERSGPQATSSVHRSTENHTEPEHVQSSTTRSTTNAPQASVPGRRATQTGRFSSFPFDETGSGHGSSHQHFAVTINEVPVIILRSEAGFRQIAERARIVEGLLNQNVQSQEGGFFAASRPTPSVWYRDPSSPAPVQILEVTPGDVIAYQRRSMGRVSAERLAAYWAVILDDYTRLFLFNRPPSQLVKLHLGETLSRIHVDMNSLESESGDARSQEDSAQLLGLLDHLSADDKEHLIELSTRIPIEFPGP